MMVLTLSRDEVLQVCNSCDQFIKLSEGCRTGTPTTTISLKELRRCKKWDQHFGSPCLYHG
jgi:hypothetical protein